MTPINDVLTQLYTILLYLLGMTGVGSIMSRQNATLLKVLCLVFALTEMVIATILGWQDVRGVTLLISAMAILSLISLKKEV